MPTERGSLHLEDQLGFVANGTKTLWVERAQISHRDESWAPPRDMQIQGPTWEPALYLSTGASGGRDRSRPTSWVVRKVNLQRQTH